MDLQKELDEKIKANNKLEYFILFLILIITLMSFLAIIQDISSGNIVKNLDMKVNMEVNQSHTFFLVSIAKILSGIFDPIIFVIISVVLMFFLIYLGRSKEAGSLIVLTLVTYIIGDLIKLFIQRIRPLNALVFENSYSFPSGHALMATVFFGALIYLFERHIKSIKIKNLMTGLATFIVVLVGLSRVYLNLHWLSDIIGGFLLGLSILAIYLIILKHTNIFKKS